MDETTPPTTPGQGRPHDETPDAVPTTAPGTPHATTPGASASSASSAEPASSGPAYGSPAPSGPAYGSPPQDGPGAGGPGVAGAGFFGSIRRFGVQRSDDRWIGGVCSGIADRLGIDPLIVRGLFVVAALLSGVGAVAYALAWALLPERRDGRIHAEELFAGRFDIAVLGIAALLVMGLGRGDGWWGVAGPPWAHDIAGFLSGLLWLGFVVGLVIAVPALISRNRATHGPGRPPAGAVPPYGTPGSSGPAPRTTPYGPGAPYASATATSPAYASGSGGGQPYTSPYAGPPYGSATAYASAPTAHASGPAAPAAPAYAATPTAYGTPRAYGPRPVTPSAPPRPKPPRRRGPGATSIGIVVALALLTLAGLLAADRAGEFDGPVLLTTLGVTALLAGIGVVVSGLRGRTSGSLGFLAIMALVASLPVGAATHRDWAWDGSGIHQSTDPVVVTTRTAAAEGLHFGAGDAVLDLTDVPLSDDLLQVPVSVGAGRVEIVVPDDAAVQAAVGVGLGKVTWDVDGDYQTASGIRMDDSTFRDQASETGSPQLSLDVSVGAGEVTITRENS